MEQEVNKQGLQTQDITLPQAEILKGISNYLTIDEMAKYRKTSRVSVYKIIKTLLNKELIHKKSRGIYGLTNKGQEGLHSLMQFTNKLRQHNLSFKIKILDSPKNWEAKREQLIQMPYFNKRVQLKNNDYDLLTFGRLQIKTTSQSVIIKLPTIYADSVDECNLQAMDLLYNAIPKIEAQFNIKLIKDYKSNIQIISQEYARLNDSLAKLYKKEGNKLYITDEEGKIWLIADYSFSVSELETISPNRADEDMTIVHAFFNDLRKNPATFSEVREAISGQLVLVNGIQQNQLIFDRNMASHLEVLQLIREAITELKNEVKNGNKN